ncbi:hypothetical protein GH733_005860, partial [Mirounga leonina]
MKFSIFKFQDGDMRELERTRQYVHEAFQAGAMTCLICIASVKRNQAVWSCSGCFCIFHMPCIQKWAKDSQFLVSSPLTDDDFGKRDYPWPCPKCRFEYKRSDTPSPCPPCPKMVTTTCYCKKAKPVPRRCSAKEWACQLPCGRKLLCGQHKCENPCHAGTNVIPVRYVEKPCHVVIIHVSKFAMLVLVENVLDLGKGSVHVRSQSFLCRVQKMYQLVEIVVTKYLNVESIDVHSVVTEVLEVEKHCRCGKHTKRMPCHKPYLCETKCVKMRDCQKHQCRRKCCPGNCPPCDQNCGRTLGCRNHKCPSVCHRVDHQLAIIQVKKNIAVTLALVLHVISLAKKFWRNVVTCVLLHHQPTGPWEQPLEPEFIQTALPCPPCQVPIP